MTDSEIVICSAVQCEDGTVIRCHRHADGIATARRGGKVPKHGPRQQGFITSRNRFVDRRVAQMLQLLAKVRSVSPDGYRGDELFSEDLY